MVRSKNALFSSLTLILALAFVAGDAWITQMNFSASAVAQIRDTGDDADEDEDEEEDNNELTTGQVVNGNSAGVRIDASGTLSLLKSTDKSKALWQARQKQAIAKLNPQIAKRSKLRKVSLNRLEKMAEQYLHEHGRLPEDMQYLAGLTSIDYVFAYPESGDVVIAGPAEGYLVDDLGRPRGKDSGRAVLELQDLVVALRAFGPNKKATPLIGVSIDPTQQGLARMQQFLSRVGGNIRPGQQTQIARGLRKSLGKQVVTIDGISPRTHFAQVLAEADYRMKLIGIGLENPPVDITTYVEKARPGSRNALARWYFVPNYESVRVSEDGLAVKLEGSGVKLVGANELVRADGTRADSGNADRASRIFTLSFTKMYPQLARRSPVFAQLRNLIDMSIAAAAIQHNDYFGQANWHMSLFSDEARFPIEVFEAPKTVATAVNAIMKGNRLMTPIGGGVEIQPLRALDSNNLLSDENGAVAGTRQEIAISELTETQWWWD